MFGGWDIFLWAGKMPRPPQCSLAYGQAGSTALLVQTCLWAGTLYSSHRFTL